VITNHQIILKKYFIINSEVSSLLGEVQAVPFYKKMTGITATNFGIKEVANDKPELIKRSEKLIYDISENCLPYDGYVEQMKKL